MMIDKVKVYRLLFLFCFLTIFSTGVFAQTVCEPVSGVCPSPSGVTCTYAATIEKGCNCFDGLDNDSDGTKDQFDSDCAYYYGLSIAGTGGQCPSIGPPPGSNVFTGVSSGAASSQNTCDTPAHLSIGDINHDGTPDILSTSKWNSTIQIVSSTTTGSWKPGDIMGDYKTQGKNTFPSNGNDWVFEHETGIADIDGDGYSEMFAIASKRTGGPNNPPTEFALCGYKFDKTTTTGHQKDLIPLWDAVSLGSNRPGNFGLADFNGDGKVEIYLRNQIFAAETGVRIANGGGNWQTAINAGPMAADMDNDGKLELVCGNFIYKVPTLSNRATTDNATLTVWKDMNTLFPASKYYPKGFNDVNEYGVGHASTTSVADVDIDGNLDVLLTGATGCSGNEGSPCSNSVTTIFYWNVSKGTLQTYVPPDGTYTNGWVWGTGRINLYDVLTTPSGTVNGYTGDNKLEALFIAGNKLFCLAQNGSGVFGLLWVRTLNDALSGILSLTNYDFDNDGKPETVYRDTKAMVVVDGQTGTTAKMSKDCASHTFSEGPIIADVNGDGATDICVPCYTNFGSFDITKSTPQQQSLGQTTLYYTDSKTWLPTRKVWNQFPYIVTNILDNMTVPKIQVGMSTVYSGTCSNGITDPRPYNLFMDQVPYLVGGCPTFPSPNVGFLQEDGTTDLNGDGSKNTSTVVVTPPTCGNLGIKAYFNIINNGNLGLSDNIDVAFFNGDPRPKTGTISYTSGSKTVTGVGTLFLSELTVGSTLVNGTTGATIGVVASITSNTSLTLVANATVTAAGVSYGKSVPLLYTNTMSISNLGVDQTYKSTTYSFNGPGVTFDMYIALYNNGAKQPITSSDAIGTDCSIKTKIYKVTIGTNPFKVFVDKVQDNLDCPPYANPNGQLKARIQIDGVDQTDLTPYTFKWYSGTTASGTVLGTNYNLPNLLGGAAAPGQAYTVTVTNTQKGNCSKDSTGYILNSNAVFPAFTVTTIHDQDQCSPANGELMVTGASTAGYVFTWTDLVGTPIGVTGIDAKNLTFGSYKVQISRGTCIDTQFPQGTVQPPTYPDAQVTSHTDVVDCINPTSGTVTGDAVLNGVVDTNTANYTYTWYFYNNATGTTGSVLPAANNDPTDPRKRINLAAGWYQLIVKKNSTQCSSTNLAIVEVKSSQVTPAVDIFQKDLQTSCDALNPNAKLYAIGSATGFTESQLTYTWFRGDNTLAANKIPTSPTAGIPEQSYGPNNDTLRFAKGGGIIYTVKVTTPNNCSFTNKFTPLEDVNQPEIILTQTPNDICDKNLTMPSRLYDGTVTASVKFKGVVVPMPDAKYTFKWWYNSTTTTGAPTTTTTGATLAGLTISDLQDSQFYTATATRTDLGCTSASSNIMVQKASVQPILQAVSTGSNNCDATLTPDGKVTVSIATIPLPVGHTYTYQWYEVNPSTGVVISTLGAANNGTSATVTNVGGPYVPNKQYRVDVIDRTNGCTNNTTQSVADVSVIPVMTTSTMPNSVCSPSTNFTGSMTATVTNMPAGYTVNDYWFRWFSGSDTTTRYIPIPTPSSTSTLSKLDAGFYTVKSKNTKTGCRSAIYTNNVTPTKVFPALLPSSTGSNNCSTSLTPDGTVSYTVTNMAQTDVTQQWYFNTGDPINTVMTPIPASPNNGDQITATKLGGPYSPNKTYTVLVTNTTTGCQNYTTATVPDNSVIPTLSTSTTGNGVCDPAKGFAGTMTATVTNIPAGYVTSDYRFRWFNGIDTSSFKTQQASPLLGLDSKSFTVVAKNMKTGCQSAAATNNVGNIKVLPALVPSSTGSNNCSTSLTPDGTVSYSVTNMVQTDLTQQWYIGTGDPTLGGMSVVPTSPNNGTSITAKFLGGPYSPNKTYTVLATNTTTGCANSTTATVPDNSIVPTLSTSTTGNGVCDPAKGFAGTMTALVTNIPAGYVVSDYRFRWFNGTDTSSFKIQQASPLTGLDSKSFTVVAKNMKTGCQSAAAIDNVGNVKIFPVLTPLGTGSNNCVVDGTVVNGVTVKNDGSATVNASGTPGGYDYQWFTGLVDLSDYPAPNAHAGTILAGQTAVTLNNVGGPNIPVGSAPHQYTVYVKDKTTGCTSFATATVPDNSTKPILNTSTTPNDICSPAANLVGTMTATLSNVQAVGSFPADYNFAWSTGATTAGNATLTKLDAGNYTVTGTNNKTGCVSDPASNNVADQKVNPVLAFTTSGSHNCSTTDINGNPITPDGTAKVDVTPQGPTLSDTFTYTWSVVGAAPAGTTATPTNVASPPSSTIKNVGGPNIPSPGTPFAYDLVVKNNRTGCTSNGQAQVADASAKPTFALQAFDNSICTPKPAGVNYNGHVDVSGSVTDNIAPGYTGSKTYKYTWTDVTNPVVAPHAIATQTNVAATSYTPLPGGDYTGVVTIVELGCVSDPVPAQVKDLPVTPIITTTPINNLNCVAPYSGSVSVTSITESGSSQLLTNYTYKWYDSTSVALGLTRAETTVAGPSQIRGLKNYVVQATSKTTGCVGTAPTTILDAKVIPVISVSFISDNINCTGTPSGVLQQSVTPAGPSYTVSWFPVAPTVYAGGVVSGNQYTKLQAGTYGANATDPTTGCKSADDSKTVGDNFTYPTIAVTPTPQSSCDPGSPNGQLAAVGSITSGSVGSTIWYNLFGTSTNGGTVSSNQTQPDASHATIIKLTDNINYTVEVIASGTGCATTQTNSITKNIAYPVLNLTATGVADCISPDGKVSFTPTGLLNANLYRLYFLHESGSTTTTDPSVIKTTGSLIQQTASPIPDQTSLVPDYYTALLRDSTTHCQSQPVSVLVTKPNFPAIDINSIAAGTSCGVGSTGGINATVTGGTGVYTFNWYKAAPINTGITFVAPQVLPNMNGAPVVQTTEDLINVGTGQYTLIVTDSKGCGDYNVQTVPSLTAPTVAWTPTDNTKCTGVAANGSIKVDVTGIAGTTYTINLFDGNDPSAPIADPVYNANPYASNNTGTVTFTFTGLKEGEYLVKVTDSASPACPDWHGVVLDQVAYNPVVDVDITAPNTSCNPTASADGSVKVTVSAVADPPNTNLGNENFEITSITPAPTVAFATPHNLGTGGNVTIPGFKPIGYSILVTDNYTGCTTTSVVTLSDQPPTPNTIDAKITPETACAIASNGKAVAMINGVIPTDATLTQYDFTWAQNMNLTGKVYVHKGDGMAGASGVALGGELLNKANATATAPGNYWPMGGVGTGSGDRIFYLQGTRNIAPGFGCSTNIAQIVIPDQHISPDMSLTTAFDSFCQANAGNPIIGDGKITVTPDADPNTAGQQMPAGAVGFDYLWSPVPTGAVPAPTQNSNAASYVIGQLYDATYTVTVTNKENSCSVVKTAVIAPAPYLLTVDATDPIIDQRICNSDGWIQVSQVTLKDNSPGSPNSSTDTESVAGNLNSLYKFYWYNTAAVTPGTELQDAAFANIVTRTLSNDGNQDKTTNGTIDYTSMKAGTYYVIAERKDPTKIGFGCPTVPFRVDVKDLHQNPVPALSVLSNTSCDPAAPGEGEIFIKVTADNTNAFFNPSPVSSGTPAPQTPFTYNYTWSGGNALTLPGAMTTGNGNGVNDSGAPIPVGDQDDYPQLLDSPTPYTIKVKNIQSGCEVTTSATVLKNSVPVFVQSVVTTDQILCDLVNGDGSITVDTVKVNNRGGTVPSSLDYVVAPGVGQGNINNFTFDWSRSAVVGHTQTTAGNALTTATYNKAALPGGFGIPIGADTYTVVATRATGSPGRGCKSAPFTVVIKDLRVNPVVTLTPFSNTSCSSTAAEGELTIAVKDNTTAVNAFSGFTYAWTSVPPLQAAPAALPFRAANDGDGFGGGENDGVGVDNDEDHPTGLLNGTYTMTVQSNKSMCITTATTDIPQNSVPVFVQTVIPIDPILCSPLPDGSLTVHEVTLNAPTGVQTFKKANLFTDFQFEWRKVGDATGFLAMNGPTVGAYTPPADTILNKTTYLQTNTVAGEDFTQPFGVGSYTVVVRRKSGSPGANCASAPYTVVLQDKSIKPVVALKPFANTACSGAFEGEIEVRVTDKTVNNSLNTFTTPFKYNYTSWVTTSTTPIAATVVMPNGANNGDPDDGVLVPPGTNPDGDGDNPQNLEDGDYTVTVVNPQTGCSSTGLTTIFKNSTPVFTQLVTPTDQILCTADGKLKVDTVKVIDRNGSTKKSGVDFPITDFGFIYDRGTVGTNVLGSTAVPSASTTLDKTNYGTIGADSYFVTATRVNGTPGFGCSAAPYKVDILNKQIFPIPSLKPFANTACSGAFEGEIEVTVTDASVSNSLNTLVMPFKYNYDWTVSATPGVINGPVFDPVLGAPTLQQQNGDINDGGAVGGNPDGDGDNPQALQDGDYTLKVTNTQTGCSSLGSTTIFKNSTPVFTQLVTPTDQILCTADGRLVVDTVKVINRSGLTQKSGVNFPLSDFGFIYDRTTIGNNVLGTTALPSASTKLDKTNYGTIGADTYFVTATRVNGAPGFGCSAAPYKVDILNKQVFPAPSLKPFANTACSGAFEGEIEVTVTDASVSNALNTFVMPFKYNYDWTVSATPGVINGPVFDPVLGAPTLQQQNGDINDGGAIGGNPDGDGDNPQQLQDGDYTVKVVNTQTGCSSLGSTTIFKNSTPVFTQWVSSTPQRICLPSGHLTVDTVRIIDRNGKTQTNTNGDFPLSDFAFSFDRTTIGNNVFTTSGTNTPHLDSLNYPPVVPNNLFDTYYVTATRMTGSPGKGCPSAPYKVDIEDKRVYPTVKFRSLANSTCPDPITGLWTKANGSVTAIASEPNGKNTDNYTFAWTLNGTAIAMVAPPAPTEVVGTPIDSLVNALDGAYIVTVTNTATGCPFAASYDLLLDMTRSTPNIIKVIPDLPTDCNPSASAEVTEITLGSTTNSSLFPPKAPPNNTLSPPGDNIGAPRFTYAWYEGSITNPPLGATTPQIGPAFFVGTPGLRAGDHFVTVIDNQTNCQSGPKQFTVLDDNIIHPVAAITQTRKNILCIVKPGNGAILEASAIEEDGTTGSYTFTWYPSLDLTGTAFGMPPASTPNTGNPNMLTDIPVGNYSVDVLNTTSGCTTSALFIVPDDSPLFAPAITTGSAPQTYCVAPYDGDANVRVTLDLARYPLTPYDNTTFTAGLYIGTKPNLSNPPDFNAPAFANVIGHSELITSDLSQAANPTLAAGKYTFKVTDSNTGCFSTDSLEILLQQVKPVIAINMDFPVMTCDPAIADGQLSATADGLVQGYTFDWYAGATATGPLLANTNILTGRDYGNYTVHVTNDITGCFEEQTHLVDSLKVHPVPPVAVVLRNQQGCLKPDGAVSATVGGEVVGYTFTWTYANDLPVLTQFFNAEWDSVKAGLYKVVAKDDITHCTSSDTVTVKEKHIIPKFNIASTPAYCCDAGTPKIGTFTLTPTVNVEFSEIRWTYGEDPLGADTLDTAPTLSYGPVVFDLCPGKYHVAVTTSEGCKHGEYAVIDYEIKPYNLVSPNSPNDNNHFVIDCISYFPNNNVKIFNRSGTLVYEADGYATRPELYFRGVGERGVYLSDKELPEGTYFYIIDKRNGQKPKAGFLELVR